MLGFKINVLMLFISSTVCEMDYKIVTYEQMKNFENKLDVLIIDVRNTDEIASTGKIGGSINIPLDQLKNTLLDLNDEEFKEKFSRDKPSLNFPLIFTCRSGRRATKAGLLVTDLGYKNVSVYKGSWNEWFERERRKKNNESLILHKIR